jgi:hypothetical protein
MQTKALLSWVVLTLIFSGFGVCGDNEKVLFREDFQSLEQWKPLFFPKIKNHSTYAVHAEEGGTSLRAESQGSASGLVYQKTFNPHEFPLLRWSWKVENVYEKGDVRKKEGDDYPIRIYLMFSYDPARVGFYDRLKYNAAKLLYGEYPPDSSLNYIWANREDDQRIVSSPYTDRSKMLLIDQGKSKVGEWVNHECNIIDDYREAFGKEPPGEARIAIMNDSDNTGEHSVSYVRFLEVYQKDDDNN